MIAIGTSGWSYDHWTPQLCPPGLPGSERLACYAAAFSTVELNSSFYRWPRDVSFRSWHNRLPAGFALYFLRSMPDWIRVAVEFRHSSWVHDDVFACSRSTESRLLRDERRRLAVCAASDLRLCLRAAART